ncbi:MAG: acyl carrier protein [Pseudomonadota bacterium]
MQKLEKVVSDILLVSECEINDESNAKNTRNWDSLRHIELIMAIETAFQVKFSTMEITSFQKLGDVRESLQAKGVAI